MPFLKENLLSEHYTWPAENEHVSFTGQPSRRSFDRFNGPQVLFIINSYGSAEDKFSVEEGRKLEEQILNHLPMDAKSEISVYNWLKGVRGAS
jgi:hypothetical protein